MKYIVAALVIAMLPVTSPVRAGEIDQMARNLEISCANHFRKRPNRPSTDSRKFCTCFAGTFTATISLRELDAANGVVTPDIQQRFDSAADVCSSDVPPDVAQAGRAWIADTN